MCSFFFLSPILVKSNVYSLTRSAPTTQRCQAGHIVLSDGGEREKAIFPTQREQGQLCSRGLQVIDGYGIAGD